MRDEICCIALAYVNVTSMHSCTKDDKVDTFRFVENHDPQNI